MSYLEELTVHKSDRFDKEGTIRNLSENFFPQTTDIRNDLNSAWQLWDAVYKGVKSHKSLFTDANMGLWSNANMWLSEYR